MKHERRAVHRLYKKLLGLYPEKFRERFGEALEQTFHDLHRTRAAAGNLPGFVAWMFFDTMIGIMREHVSLFAEGVIMKNILANGRLAALVSSILLAVAFIAAPWIYLVGNLRDAMGPLSYDLADFLYGPVWAASLVTIVSVLREHIGERAQRRMSMALLAAVLAAATMVIVALIRSANRHYHLDRPELHLENAQTILIIWTNLVTALTNAGFHFLGWSLVLIGSAGWTSRRLPRALSLLYLVTGVSGWFVYLLAPLEGLVVLLGIVTSIWQGGLLWKSKPNDWLHAPQDVANRGDHS